MRPSRRVLTERNTDLAARLEIVTAQRDEYQDTARVIASTLRCTAAELSRCKDVLASHIVAAGHPSTGLHDPKAFAEALRVALEDVGVDIRLELARLEGADL